jgi:NAD(P)-dependent dehydrogenase (short-subunit alcohol dehydrogenase family)
VRALANDEAIIVATGRREADLAALREEIGLPADRWFAQPVELADLASTQAFVDSVTAHVGGIDILVALAGGWRGGSVIADSETSALDWLLRTNLVTAFNACRAVLPGMTARGWGRIIAIGARSAIAGQAGSGLYAASKAALQALIQSVALETRNHGITANIILASTIDTLANRAAMPDADHSRWVPPAHIAATIHFLC